MNNTVEDKDNLNSSQQDFLNTRLNPRDFSFRSFHGLMENHITTVGQLIKLNRSDLEQLSVLERKSVEEILQVIYNYQAKLKTVSDKDASDSNQKQSHFGNSKVNHEGLTKSQYFLNTALNPNDFSTRSFHKLMSIHVTTVGQLIKLHASDLEHVSGLGRKSIEEILYAVDINKEKLEKISSSETLVDNRHQFSAWLDSKEGIEQLISFYKQKNTSIDVLEQLSSRAYNLLTLNDATSIYMLIGKNASEFVRKYRMDNMTASEVVSIVKQYLSDHRSEIEKNLLVSTDDSVFVKQFNMRDHIEKAKEYLQQNDVNLNELGLSLRAYNGLTKSGYHKFSEIAFLSENDLRQVPRMGEKTVHEIYLIISSRLKKHEKRIQEYCLGNTDELLDDEEIRSRILALYQDSMNEKYDFESIKEKLALPKTIHSERLKHVIGRMLTSHDLEYIDGYCYRVYGKFEDYYLLCPTKVIDNRDKAVIRYRLDGKTLEEIGSLYDVTRERIRQIGNKAIKKVKLWYTSTTGMKWFDEDYFQYLYENYSLTRNDSEKWLGITKHNFNYLEMVNAKRGKKDLNDALTDQNLDISLRLKIRIYLDRNKVRLGDQWIPRNRSNIIEYVVRTQCKEDTGAEEFVDKYNSFCVAKKIPLDLHIDKDSKRYVESHLSTERYLLWKQFRKFRFYDIDARDYTDLIDGLGIKNYENIEYSTLKFIEDYPDLMKKYDIHDQYELHNLLKKIIPEGSYHKIHFDRMPIIVFGSFDRDQAIMQLIRDHSPISTNDLCDLIHQEYGIDKRTILANNLAPFSIYSYKGIYSIPECVMTDEHAAILKAHLPNPFYYTSEIAAIYSDLFPDADPDEISPYNLRKIGFHVYTNYAVQNFDSAYDYFKHLLTKDDVFDITPYRRRYGYIQIFNSLIIDLKTRLELFEYLPNQFVQFKKIQKAGFTKEDLKAFSNQVYDYVEPNRCFTMRQLRRKGFTSELDDLGFDDWFYGDILCNDSRFKWSKILQNLVMRKGSDDVTMSSFITEIIHDSAENGIDRYDLVDILSNDYGCSPPDKWKLIKAVKNSDIYYDEILDRFYKTEDSYYDDLDSEE